MESKPTLLWFKYIDQTLKSSIMAITTTPVLQVLQLHQDSGKGLPEPLTLQPLMLTATLSFLGVYKSLFLTLNGWV